MSAPVFDVTNAIQAKSDQLNAADIVGGPITVRILGVRGPTGQADPDKQKVEVVISDPWKPWRPCKTMLRLMSAMWGTDAGKWVGRTVQLYNDPSVTFGKDATGGIRLGGADIQRPFSQCLQVKRGGHKTYTVEPIPALPAPQSATPKRAPSPLGAYLSERLPQVGIVDLTGDEKKALMEYLGPDALPTLQALDDDAFRTTILTGAGRLPKE